MQQKLCPSATPRADEPPYQCRAQIPHRAGGRIDDQHPAHAAEKGIAKVLTRQFRANLDLAGLISLKLQSQLVTLTFEKTPLRVEREDEGGDGGLLETLQPRARAGFAELVVFFQRRNLQTFFPLLGRVNFVAARPIRVAQLDVVRGHLWVEFDGFF